MTKAELQEEFKTTFHNEYLTSDLYDNLVNIPVSYRAYVEKFMDNFIQEIAFSCIKTMEDNNILKEKPKV